MEDINYLSLIGDLLAIVSLILSMYFYYGSRTKEIDELKKVVNDKSKEGFDNIYKELSEIKGGLNHLKSETFALLKDHVSFMQGQVGNTGTGSTITPEIKIWNIIMEHQSITIETLCKVSKLDRVMIVGYVEKFKQKGTLNYDGQLVKITHHKDNKGEEGK